MKCEKLIRNISYNIAHTESISYQSMTDRVIY